MEEIRALPRLLYEGVKFELDEIDARGDRKMTEREALELLMRVNELGTTIMSLTKKLEEDQAKLAVEEVENAGKQWEDLKEVVLRLVDETRLRVPTAR